MRRYRLGSVRLLAAPRASNARERLRVRNCYDRPVPWRKTPLWLSFGGAWLALVAGFTNAVGFLGVAHRGLSHVTGQVTQLATGAVEADVASAVSAALLVVSFFVGAVFTGAIIRREEVSSAGRYSVVLLAESLLLATAAVSLSAENAWAQMLVTLAMGMQNALATSYSGAVVRTTHVTGLTTDLGLLLGHALRGEQVDRTRLKLQATLLAGFTGGSAAGAWCFPRLEHRSLFIPSVALGIAAVGWLSLPARKP